MADSTVDLEWAPTRLVVFGAMGAMLAVALATPGAFGDDTPIAPIAVAAPAVLTLALLAAVWIVLIGYETVHA